MRQHDSDDVVALRIVRGGDGVIVSLEHIKFFLFIVAFQSVPFLFVLGNEEECCLI